MGLSRFSFLTPATRKYSTKQNTPGIAYKILSKVCFKMAGLDLLGLNNPNWVFIAQYPCYLSSIIHCWKACKFV